jgi:hypothetical protein
MLSRPAQPRPIPACNDNGLLSKMGRSPMPLANIVQVATEAAGAVALSYVVDGVLIITGRTT